MRKKNILIICIIVVILAALVALGVYMGSSKKKTVQEEKKTQETQQEKSKEDSEKEPAEEVQETSETETTQGTQEDPETEPTEETQENSEYDANNNARIICIDPGHQRSGDSTQEPNGPNSGTMKARVTGGTHGATSGLYEYELNLMIAQQLRDELQRRGYTVYMTRESHDVNISNKERAEYATSVGAAITVRIHANGSDNTGVSGALALTPSSSNPYVAHLATASYSLSQCILDSYCAATGLSDQGIQANDTMTGINWCTMPVTILEMGYMTNPNDDSNMANPSFQAQMVQGIANGIDQYFAQ